MDRIISNWLANLYDFGLATYDAFLLPGTFVLSQIVSHAPSLAQQLGIVAEGAWLPALLSLLIWSLPAIMIWKVMRLLRNAARIVNASIRSVGSTILCGVRIRKTLLIRKLRPAIQAPAPGNPIAVSEVNFSDLDVTVLRIGAALPAGLVLSAPDVAGHLTMRPARVQCILDKLRKHELVDSVIGATDGFDNYRLTPSGIALLAAWHYEGK